MGSVNYHGTPGGRREAWLGAAILTVFTLLFLCLALTFLMSDTMWVYRVCPQRDKRDEAPSHPPR